MADATPMVRSADGAPLIVGIGGGASRGSSTEQALALALSEASRLGARTEIFGGGALLQLPLYMAPNCQDAPEGQALVAAIRQADGIVIASPGYHGSVSGMVKNALDYIEETSRDTRPYLADLPVGLIAVAGGYPAATNTLNALRTIVHALRGWPTPYGAVVNSAVTRFHDGACIDAGVADQIRLVGAQVAQFVGGARWRAGPPSAGDKQTMTGESK